ncbi:MAG: hypothetical protein O3C34_06170 [Proteobacteria bacterium]|nr:hypothetical protein [Pseudomonadota bacterium]
MKNFQTWSLIPATAILLSACNAVIVESYPIAPAYYKDGDFERATSKGAVTAIVVGNPFTSQSTTFADNVRALMKNQAGDVPVSFVSQPGADTTNPYKVVVVFNARANVDNRSICQMEGQTPTTPSIGDQVSVTMVFCEGNNAKSGTRGRAGGIKGQNDSTFVSLVQQVANAMIPPYGYERSLRNGDS